MELSRRSAELIVREVNEVSPQKINLMNRQGIIIASTDASRVGQFHGAAARLVREGIDEIRVHRDGEYPGALRGTNFLLKAQGEPIGVLGVTGPYDEILAVAKVIRKMTELIVADQERVRQETYREARRARFLEDWLTQSASAVTADFCERGLALGLDIRRSRRVLALSAEGRELSSEEALARVQSFLAGAYPKLSTCLIPPALAVLTERGSDEELRTLATELKAHIEAQLPVRLTIGIDSPAPDCSRMQEAWAAALKALQSASRRGQTSIKLYREINMEIFADTVPETAKRAYIRRIFAGYTERELGDAVKMLELFYAHSGSLAQTAAALFIHRNTLQQHLKKIAARTGYDPRSLGASAIFYIVIYFYHDLQLMSQEA